MTSSERNQLVLSTIVLMVLAVSVLGVAVVGWLVGISVRWVVGL